MPFAIPEISEKTTADTGTKLEPFKIPEIKEATTQNATDPADNTTQQPAYPAEQLNYQRPAATQNATDPVANTVPTPASSYPAEQLDYQPRSTEPAATQNVTPTTQTSGSQYPATKDVDVTPQLEAPQQSELEKAPFSSAPDKSVPPSGQPFLPTPIDLGNAPSEEDVLQKASNANELSPEAHDKLLADLANRNKPAEPAPSQETSSTGPNGEFKIGEIPDQKPFKIAEIPDEGPPKTAEEIAKKYNYDSDAILKGYGDREFGDGMSDIDGLKLATQAATYSNDYRYNKWQNEDGWQKAWSKASDAYSFLTRAASSFYAGYGQLLSSPFVALKAVDHLKEALYPTMSRVNPDGSAPSESDIENYKQMQMRVFTVGNEEALARLTESGEDLASKLIYHLHDPAKIMGWEPKAAGAISPGTQLMWTDRGVPILSGESANEMDSPNLMSQAIALRNRSDKRLGREAGYGSPAIEQMQNMLAGKTVATPEQLEEARHAVDRQGIQDVASTTELAGQLAALGAADPFIEATGFHKLTGLFTKTVLGTGADVLQSVAEKFAPEAVVKANAEAAKKAATEEAITKGGRSAEKAQIAQGETGSQPVVSEGLKDLGKKIVNDRMDSVLAASIGAAAGHAGFPWIAVAYPGAMMARWVVNGAVGVATALGRKASAGISLAADEMADALRVQANDHNIGNSLFTAADTRSPLKQIFGGFVKSNVEGAFNTLPLAAVGTNTPEEFGSFLGLGAGLHAGGELLRQVPQIALNEIGDKVLITDMNRNRNRLPADPPKAYGTDPSMDKATAEVMTTKNPDGTSRFSNDVKHTFNEIQHQWDPIAEVHALNPKPYSLELKRLTDLGYINDPDLNSRGVAIDPNPIGHKARILIRSDALIDATHHEISHPLVSRMPIEDKAALFAAVSANNDPVNFTKVNYGRDYNTLPTNVELAHQIAQGLYPGEGPHPGLTKEDIQTEMVTEAVSGMLKGKSIRDLTSNPTLVDNARNVLWRMMESMGFNPFTLKSQSVMGIKHSILTTMLMEPILRKTIRDNIGIGTGVPLEITKSIAKYAKPAPQTHIPPAPPLREVALDSGGVVRENTTHPFTPTGGEWKPVPKNVNITQAQKATTEYRSQIRAENEQPSLNPSKTINTYSVQEKGTDPRLHQAYLPPEDVSLKQENGQWHYKTEGKPTESSPEAKPSTPVERPVHAVDKDVLKALKHFKYNREDAEYFAQRATGATLLQRITDALDLAKKRKEEQEASAPKPKDKQYNQKQINEIARDGLKAQGWSKDDIAEHMPTDQGTGLKAMNEAKKNREAKEKGTETADQLSERQSRIKADMEEKSKTPPVEKPEPPPLSKAEEPKTTPEVKQPSKVELPQAPKPTIVRHPNGIEETNRPDGSWEVRDSKDLLIDKGDSTKPNPGNWYKYSETPKPIKKAPTATLESGKVVTAENTDPGAKPGVYRTSKRRYEVHDGEGSVYRKLTWNEANELHDKLQTKKEETAPVEKPAENTVLVPSAPIDRKHGLMFIPVQQQQLPSAPESAPQDIQSSQSAPIEQPEKFSIHETLPEPPPSDKESAPPPANPIVIQSTPENAEFIKHLMNQGLTPGEAQHAVNGVESGEIKGERRAPDLAIDRSVSARPGSFSEGRGTNNVQKIVIHSSDGNAATDIKTLTGNDPNHLVSSHFYVEKNKKVHQFVDTKNTAYGAGPDNPTGYNNGNTINIEQEHVDGKDKWDMGQVETTAKLVAQQLKEHPNLILDDVVGHSDIAPGRKVDPVNYPWDKFRELVKQYGGEGVTTREGGIKEGPRITNDHQKMGAQYKGAGRPIGEDKGGQDGAFGYIGDSTPDTGSLLGEGAYPHVKVPGSMIEGYSAGLTAEGGEWRGLVPGQEFMYKGRVYRWDDTTPKHRANYADVPDDYVDMYRPSHAPDKGVSQADIDRETKIAMRRPGYNGIGTEGDFGSGGGGGYIGGGGGGPAGIGKSEEKPAQTPSYATAPKGNAPEPTQKPIDSRSIAQAEDSARAEINQRNFESEHEYEQAVNSNMMKRLAEQHATSLAPDDTRVRLLENGNIAGTHFVEGDAFHDWLQRDQKPETMRVVQTIQDAIANKRDIKVNYDSAPQTELGMPTGAQRSAAQTEHEAKARAQGLADIQTAGKSLMPTWVGVSSGKKPSIKEPNPPPFSIMYGGVSADKTAGNSHNITQGLGHYSPYGAGPLGTDADLDMHGYLQNQNNGWKGDGSAKLDVPPGEEANVPKETPGYIPYKMSPEKAQFWNLSVAGSSAKLSARGAKTGPGARSTAALEMAERNAGYSEKANKGAYTNPLAKRLDLMHGPQKVMIKDPATGEMVPKLNPKTGKPVKPVDWTEAHLHSGFESLRADLTDPNVTDAPKIHPGHEMIERAIREKGPPHAFCYSSDTEILARRGWVLFSDLLPDDEVATRNCDTKSFEWQLPSVYVNEPYAGSMIHFYSASLDLLVTPNHRMVVNKRTRVKMPSGSDLVELDLNKKNRLCGYCGVSLEGKPRHAIFCCRKHKQLFSTKGAISIPGPEKILIAEDLLFARAKKYTIPVTSVWHGETVQDKTFEIVPYIRSSNNSGFKGVSWREDSHKWRSHIWADGKQVSLGSYSNIKEAVAVVEKARREMPACVSFTNFGPLPTRISGDDFCALVGAYLAEGSLHPDWKAGLGKKRGIQIAQQPQSKGFEPYKELIERIQGYSGWDGHNGFTIRRKALSDYFVQFGLCDEKFVPDEIMNASPEQIRIFLYYYLLGDGTFNGINPNLTRVSLEEDNKRYVNSVTVSKKLADDLVELWQKVGYSASVSVRPPGEMTFPEGRSYQCKTQYFVNVRFTQSKYFTAKSLNYDGFIHCVEVPNGVVYVRRNGRPAWCGNSTKAGFMPGELLDKGERIASAAVRTGKHIYTAPNHHDAAVAALDAGEPQEPVGWEHGYTTIPTEEHPNGRFVRPTAKNVPHGTKAGFMPGVEFGHSSPEDFIKDRDKTTRAGYLSPLSPEDIKDHKLFSNKEGTVGAAVDPHGDIQNLFNNGGPKGAGADAMAHAISQGGNTLDAFDDYLPKLYRQFGFQETGRMKFNPDYAPQGWDYSRDDNPDVVFMAHKGYPPGGPEAAIERAKGDKNSWIKNEQTNKYEDDYDAAKQSSRRAVHRGGTEVLGAHGETGGETSHLPAEAPLSETGEGHRGLASEGRAIPIGDNQAEADTAGQGRAGIAHADAERLGAYRQALQEHQGASDRIDRAFRQGGKPHSIDVAAEESAKQIPALKKLAEERGELVSPMEREPDTSGAEHHVWFSDDGKTVTKETYYRDDPAHGERKRFGAVPTTDAVDVRDATPHEYLDRVGINNDMGRKVRVVGVVDQGNGETRIRTEEPAISDATGHPSMDEIAAHMHSKGFEPKDWKTQSWHNPETKVLASDAAPHNFLKTEHGVEPVDLMLRRSDNVATPLTDEDRLSKNEHQRSQLVKQQTKLDTTKPEEDKAWDIMASKIHDLEREHERLTESMKAGPDVPRGTKAAFMPGDVIEHPGTGELEEVLHKAVRFPSGNIYTGGMHYEAQDKGIEAGEPENAAITSGYVTSKNRFIGDEEGWALAKANDQLKAGAKKISDMTPEERSQRKVTGLGRSGLESSDLITPKAAFMPMAGERGAGFEEAQRRGRTFLNPYDQRHRYEISDHDLTWKGPDTEDGNIHKLGDVINHPTLFKDYPDAKDIQFKVDKSRSGAGFDRYEGPEGRITMSNASNKEMLVHEIQHWVQQKEGFQGTGSNLDRALYALESDPQAIPKIMKIAGEEYDRIAPHESETWSFFFPNKDTYVQHALLEAAENHYHTDIGEIEAREAARRQRMAPEERASTPPYDPSSRGYIPPSAAHFMPGDTVTIGANGNKVRETSDYDRSTSGDEMVRYREPGKAAFMPPDNALPVEYAKNKDGSPKLDKKGKPVAVKINFDLSKAPRIAKKQPEETMPDDAPNTMKRFDYLTDNQQKQLSYQDKVSATGTLAKRAVVQLREWLKDPSLKRAEEWYESMRKKLAESFGEDHQMFSHILGVTSPRENPHENFLYALEAYERLKRGDFKRHIDLYQKAHDMQKAGTLVPHVEELIGRELKGDKKGNKSDAEAMAEYIKHHDILPERENGKLYGTHGNGILRAISERWADEPGAPKTKNYAGNLLGTTNEATIDSWAARFIRQLGYDGEKQWRIQPKSETGVGDYDFAFSQLVFKKAAAGLGMPPDAVQAVAWYALKADWEQKGWMKGMGAEQSSLDTPFDMAHPEGPSGPRKSAAEVRQMFADKRQAAEQAEKDAKAAAKEAAKKVKEDAKAAVKEAHEAAKAAKKSAKLGPPVPSMAK